jgi:AraC-like DNA-binding protein
MVTRPGRPRFAPDGNFLYFYIKYGPLNDAMQPLFEQITTPDDSSWTLFHRRLPAFPFCWHYHATHELTLTLDSRGHRTVGDHFSAYDHGDLVLVGSALPHTWASHTALANDGMHQAYVLWFAPAWVDRVGGLREFDTIAAMFRCAARGLQFSDAMRARARVAVPQLAALPPPQRLVQVLDLLLELSADTEAVQLASPAYADGAPSDIDNAQPERFRLVLDHVHRHYAEPLSLPALSQQFAMSVSTLQRAFRRHTRLAFIDYLIQLRLGHACTLLLQTQRQIAAIAQQCGYANLANFNRQFKAAKGCTPRAFRLRASPPV